MINIQEKNNKSSDNRLTTKPILNHLSSSFILNLYRYLIEYITVFAKDESIYSKIIGELIYWSPNLTEQ